MNEQEWNRLRGGWQAMKQQEQQQQQQQYSHTGGSPGLDRTSPLSPQTPPAYYQPQQVPPQQQWGPPQNQAWGPAPGPQRPPSMAPGTPRMPPPLPPKGNQVARKRGLFWFFAGLAIVTALAFVGTLILYLLK